jgi:hypothetical protein
LEGCLLLAQFMAAEALAAYPRELVHLYCLSRTMLLLL